MRELRYERKYRIDNLDHRVVINEVLLHPAGFRRQYPDRYVSNIYFDTPELLTFNDNLYGISERAKYRLRWYGRSMMPAGEARWEVKQKSNNLGTKLVSTTHITGKSLAQLVRLVNARYAQVHRLVPALYNYYLRSYFISADRKFRFTVDREMHFLPVAGNTFMRGKAQSVPSVVMEMKYDKAHDDDASEIFRYLSFRQTKNSKYVTGMMHMPQ